jgi:hypothetical protein
VIRRMGASCADVGGGGEDVACNTLLLLLLPFVNLPFSRASRQSPPLAKLYLRRRAAFTCCIYLG